VELAGPVVVADHRHEAAGPAFGAVVLGSEAAAGDERDAERAVTVAGHPRTGRSALRAGLPDRERLAEREATEPRDPYALGVLGERLDCQVREVRARLPAVDDGDLHQSAGVGDRKRPQQQRVDQREHGGVCADAEREGQQGRQREGRAATETPRRIPKVLTEDVPTRRSPARAHRLLHQADVAEAAVRLERRRLGAYAARSQLFGLEVQVVPDFPVEVLVARAPAPESHVSSAGRITWPMARARASHLDSSTRSCRRPAGVSR
jgi:hypothetical protein